MYKTIKVNKVGQVYRQISKLNEVGYNKKISLTEPQSEVKDDAVNKK